MNITRKKEEEEEKKWLFPGGSPVKDPALSPCGASSIPRLITSTCQRCPPEKKNSKHRGEGSKNAGLLKCF